ncbi:MAG: hypothetical protein AAFO95_19465 [Cyanobacteria bacterium J06600_6]
MKSILYLVTISISLVPAIVKAQTPTPDAGGFNQLGRQPVQQPRVFSNPNSRSRQFFQQGRENLYFLEKSEPILQIEQSTEAEKEVEADKIQERETLEQPE